MNRFSPYSRASKSYKFCNYNCKVVGINDISTNTLNNEQSINTNVKGLWTHEEDTKLLNIVMNSKNIKWVNIGKILGTRTGKQCRERWHNHLDPSLNKSPFTQTEKQTIIDFYKKHGSKWSKLSKLLPGRSDNSIKNYFNTCIQKNKQCLNNDNSDPKSPRFSELPPLSSVIGSSSLQCSPNTQPIEYLPKFEYKSIPFKYDQKSSYLPPISIVLKNINTSNEILPPIKTNKQTYESYNRFTKNLKSSMDLLPPIMTNYKYSK